MSRARYRFFLTVGMILLSGTGFKAGAQDALTGPVEMEEILKQDRIYRIYAERYQPDSLALNYLKEMEPGASLKVFFGTWCRESRKYIPGLIKILQELEGSGLQAEFIGVDSMKKIPTGLLNKFDIKYIPTVVVLKGGAEIGRIEEIPQSNFETDLVHLFEGVSKQAGNQ